jgi:hypothetical protein
MAKIKIVTDTLETLLAEVETIAADILQGELAALDGVTAACALDCCRRIRDALNTGNAAGAAHAGCQLGERLAELRKLGAGTRRLAAHKSPVQRDHERDTERRAVQKKYEKRGFKTSKADEKAAAELGVSPRQIRRARRGN